MKDLLEMFLIQLKGCLERYIRNNCVKEMIINNKRNFLEFEDLLNIQRNLWLKLFIEYFGQEIQIFKMIVQLLKMFRKKERRDRLKGV